MKTKSKTIPAVQDKESELNYFDVENALKIAGTIPRNAYDIRIYVAIPGGGDYSNMKMSICGEFPLYVDYKVAEETDPIRKVKQPEKQYIYYSNQD